MTIKIYPPLNWQKYYRC